MATKQYDNYADLITFTRASTGTYLDSDGLLKTATTNTPRIEYDANGNRRGLLIEEARTNLTLTSENFAANYNLSRTGVSVSHGGVADPAGGTSASTFTYSGSNASEGIFDDLASGVGNTTYTFSIWLKSATLSQARLLLKNASSDSVKAQAVVNLSSEWQRFDVTGTTDGASAGARIEFTTNGVAGSMDIWGAQLEAGSFPTSYIPTSGSTATRSADVASIPTSAFGYNQKAGTVVVEGASNPASDINFAIAELSDGTGANRIFFGTGGSNTSWNPFIITNSVSQGALNPGVSVPPKTTPKLSLAFANNDAQSAAGGTLSPNDASVTLPVINQIHFGSSRGVGSFWNYYIKSIQYYPRRLTNAQLVELTS